MSNLIVEKLEVYQDGVNIITDAYITTDSQYLLVDVEYFKQLLRSADFTAEDALKKYYTELSAYIHQCDDIAHKQKVKEAHQRASINSAQIRAKNAYIKNLQIISAIMCGLSLSEIRENLCVSRTKIYMVLKNYQDGIFNLYSDYEAYPEYFQGITKGDIDNFLSIKGSFKTIREASL